MHIDQWFSNLVWSPPIPIESLRSNRSVLPRLSGVYVFTNYAGRLEKNTGVLYVGKAGNLFTRVPAYLVDPSTMPVISARTGKLSSSLRHAGKNGILTELQARSRGTAPSGIYVRWSTTLDPQTTETLLIGYLRPAFNTQGLGSDD